MINIYKGSLKHDNGKFTITVTARSIDDAKQMIMKAEGCPESAIVAIKQLENKYR